MYWNTEALSIQMQNLTWGLHNSFWVCLFCFFVLLLSVPPVVVLKSKLSVRCDSVKDGACKLFSCFIKVSIFEYCDKFNPSFGCLTLQPTSYRSYSCNMKSINLCPNRVLHYYLKLIFVVFIYYHINTTFGFVLCQI